MYVNRFNAAVIMISEYAHVENYDTNTFIFDLSRAGKLVLVRYNVVHVCMYVHTKYTYVLYMYI